MKRIPRVVLTIMLAVWALCISGCGPKDEKYGEALNESAGKTSISSILLSPQKYLDKEVVIDGVIFNECPSGCWMNVRDASGGLIFVEMLGAPFTPLPQRTGRLVLVKGVIYQSTGGAKETKILAKGLVIRQGG